MAIVAFKMKGTTGEAMQQYYYNSGAFFGLHPRVPLYPSIFKIKLSNRFKIKN
jgi:hypothetical protein